MKKISECYKKKTNSEYIERGDFDLCFHYDFGGNIVNNVLLFGLNFTINGFKDGSIYFYGKDKEPYKEGDLYFKNFFSRIKS